MIEGNDSSERIAALEAELDAMRTAATVQEQVIADGYAQMDKMLVDLEHKADALERASVQSAAAQAVLDRILNTMHGLLMVVGTDGRISNANRRLAEAVGVEREALIGERPERFFISQELQDLAARHGIAWPEANPVARVFGHPWVKALDGSLVTAEGERLPHVFRSGVLRNRQDKREGVVIVGNDVRELKASLEKVQRAHAGMKLVLDNIDQGLVSVDREGRVSPECSARVREWFGPVEGGERVWDLFDRYQPRSGTRYRMGLAQLLDGFLPRDICLLQLQGTLSRGGQTLAVAVRCVGDDDPGAPIASVLFVVTDITAQIAAERAEAERQEFLAMVERIVIDKGFFLQFFEDACGLVEHLGDEADPAIQFRLVHTLKGNTSIFGIQSVAAVCHEIEHRLAAEKTALTADELERIRAAWGATVGRVGRFVADAGDAISISQDTYQRLMRELERRPELQHLAREVSRWRYPTVEAQLRQLGMQAGRLATQLGKPVGVTLDCDDSRLPRKGWSRLWGGLVHLIRNALDHGIESAEVRLARGKPAEGRLLLGCRTDGRCLTLSVEDDGGGIGWDKIRARAVKLGLPADTHDDLVEALFADGLSTREQASDVSGRGVGMAAVREVVRDLHGALTVDSQPGRGTRFTFSFTFPDAARAQDR